MKNTFIAFIFIGMQLLAQSQDCPKAEALNKKAIEALDNENYSDCYTLLNQSQLLCPALAQTMLIKGDYFNALLSTDSSKYYYNRFLWSNYDNKTAYNKLALVYFYEDKLDSSFYYLNTVLKQFPNDTTANFNTAELYFILGKRAEAEKYYLKVIAAVPNHLSASLRLCDLYTAQSRLLESKKIIAQLKTKYPNDYDVLISECQILIQEQQWENALSLSLACKKIDSLESAAYFLSAVIYEENNRYQLAIEEYNKILTFDYENADAYLQRGYLLYEMKEHELALLDFDDALAIDSSLHDALFQKGIIYYDQEMYPLSIVSLEQYLKYVQNDADAYYNLGNAFLALDKYSEAITNYSLGISLRADPDFYYNRGYVYFLNKEYNLAISDLSTYLRNQPDDAEAYYLRCLSNRMIERKSEACTDCSMAKFLGKTDISKNLLKNCKQAKKNSN